MVKKSTKGRKAVQKKKTKKGDWTNCGRGDFRKQGGTVVAAAVGQEHKTCVPDATFVCVKMQCPPSTRPCFAHARGFEMMHQTSTPRLLLPAIEAAAVEDGSCAHFLLPAVCLEAVVLEG